MPIDPRVELVQVSGYQVALPWGRGGELQCRRLAEDVGRNELEEDGDARVVVVSVKLWPQ